MPRVKQWTKVSLKNLVDRLDGIEKTLEDNDSKDCSVIRSCTNACCQGPTVTQSPQANRPEEDHVGSSHNFDVFSNHDPQIEVKYVKEKAEIVENKEDILEQRCHVCDWHGIPMTPQRCPQCKAHDCLSIAEAPTESDDDETDLRCLTAEELLQLIGTGLNGDEETGCMVCEPDDDEDDEVLVNQEEFQEVDIVAAGDSGCGDHILSADDVPGYAVQPSEGSLKGKGYVAANGGRITNDGEVEVNMVAPNQQRIRSKFQVAKVSRPLMSIARICDQGNTVLFNKEHAIVRTSTGRELTRFDRKGMLYLIKFRLKAPTSEGFRGPGR